MHFPKSVQYASPVPKTNSWVLLIIYIVTLSVHSDRKQRNLPLTADSRHSDWHTTNSRQPALTVIENVGTYHWQPTVGTLSGTEPTAGTHSDRKHRNLPLRASSRHSDWHTADSRQSALTVTENTGTYHWQPAVGTLTGTLLTAGSRHSQWQKTQEPTTDSRQSALWAAHSRQPAQVFCSRDKSANRQFLSSVNRPTSVRNASNSLCNKISNYFSRVSTRRIYNATSANQCCTKVNTM